MSTRLRARLYGSSAPGSAIKTRHERTARQARLDVRKFRDRRRNPGAGRDAGGACTGPCGHHPRCRTVGDLRGGGVVRRLSAGDLGDKRDRAAHAAVGDDRRGRGRAGGLRLCAELWDAAVAAPRDGRRCRYLHAAGREHDRADRAGEGAACGRARSLLSSSAGRSRLPPGFRSSPFLPPISAGAPLMACSRRSPV